MFRFSVEQKIFEIGKVKIGGQPGELPTVLIGNIFYKGMPEIADHKRGEFDRKSVLKWIKIAEELSGKTGVPHFIDIMAMYPEAMRRYVTFISEHSDSVLLVDGTNSDTRVAGLERVKELGLQERTIFNAISPRISQREIEAIRDSGVTAAILLAYNEIDFSPEGRTAILKGYDKNIGLLKIAEKARTNKILVDTIVFDVPSIAYATEAIKLVKNELGYPAGCSPANATYGWKRSQSEISKSGFGAYNASAHAIAQFGGADFLIYGPIKQARNMIPACAMNDAIVAYHALKRLGIRPLVSEHPLYKIF
ncbi:MAG: tetrahydromethanopterin S-methyltransferase subunit H [bacterium]